MSSEVSGKKSGNAAVPFPAGTPELQANLRRLDRLANLGLVSASIAHEIKNGLVAINTFVELLLQKSDDEEMARLVQRELKRIDALATQMLRFSTHKPAVFAPVKMHDLLNHSLRLLEHQMNGRMIALERDFRAVPDTLRGDESQLQQTFMNLLLNAVEAIGNNGELSVITEAVKDPGGADWLKISIRDTGSGITPENLKRLFEPFFTTKKNGTGLGLAIARRIVEEHRGTIEVHSEARCGSTFVILLPVE
jgi:signal transduction histidine kinase